MSVQDLEHMSNALGTAVLSASTGEVQKVWGDLAGDEASRLEELYHCFLDAVEALQDEPLKRVTIAFKESQYSMGVSGEWLYIAHLSAEIK